MKIDWKQVTFSLLIGALLGFAFGTWVMKHHFPGYRWGDKRYSRMLKYFNSKLDLSETQKEKVKGILDSKRKKVKELRKELRPRWKTMHENTREEIRKILNPEQKEKFRALEAKMDARRKKRQEKRAHQ